MENETEKILSKILGKRELEKVPPDIATKIENYFEQRFEEFLITKALHSTAQRNGKIVFHIYIEGSKMAIFCVCIIAGWAYHFTVMPKYVNGESST